MADESVPEADGPQRFRTKAADMDALVWTGGNSKAMAAFVGDAFEQLYAHQPLIIHSHGPGKALIPGDVVTKSLATGVVVVWSARDFADSCEPSPLANQVDALPADHSGCIQREELLATRRARDSAEGERDRLRADVDWAADEIAALRGERDGAKTLAETYLTKMHAAQARTEEAEDRARSLAGELAAHSLADSNGQWSYEYGAVNDTTGEFVPLLGAQNDEAATALAEQFGKQPMKRRVWYGTPAPVGASSSPVPVEETP